MYQDDKKFENIFDTQHLLVTTGLAAVVVVVVAAADDDDDDDDNDDDNEKDLSMGTQYMCNLFVQSNYGKAIGAYLNYLAYLK